MDVDKLIKKICFAVLVLFAIKYFIGIGTFKTTTHKGIGYSIKYPLGWKKIKEESDLGVFVTATIDKNVATFIPSEIDSTATAGKPGATVIVASAKLSDPSWIEDLWPDIMAAIIRSGVKVIDKGEIKIEKQIAKWVLFQERAAKIWHLEFYFTDEKNGFYKIMYIAEPRAFDPHRKTFEEGRSPFQFVFGFF